MSDDLISRQAAIEALGEEPEVWSGKDEYEMGLNNQWHYDRNAIMAVPTAEPRWIPVTERLPEENKPVLVTHHGKHQAFVSVDWIDPYTHEWNRTCNVIAWMPLPMPWKGESDANNN